MSSLSESPYVQSIKWMVKLAEPSRTNVRIKSDDQDPGKQEAYHRTSSCFYRVCDMASRQATGVLGSAISHRGSHEAICCLAFELQSAGHRTAVGFMGPARSGQGVLSSDAYQGCGFQHRGIPT